MASDTVKLIVTEQKRGKLVQLNCSIRTVYVKERADSMSYNIGCWATVRVRFAIAYPVLRTSISYKKHESQTEPNLQINITCSMNKQIRHFLCPEEWSDFIKMGETDKRQDGFYAATLVFSVHITEVGSPCIILYNDHNFTDFCLMPESGSGVPVHKSIMAAHSNVFKTMLTGEWMETSRDCVEVKGATQETLQHLKDFMYLGSLPDDSDLRPLLLIAKCYMMHHLEGACAKKLARTVKAKDLPDLVKFATDNGLYRLVMAILHISDENIYASEIKAAEVKTK